MGTTLKFLSENTVRKCTFGNAAAKEHNAAVTELLALIEKRNRAIQDKAAKALKAARARRLRRMAVESLGLKKVRGAVTGTTYYE